MESPFRKELREAGYSRPYRLIYQLVILVITIAIILAILHILAASTLRFDIFVAASAFVMGFVFSSLYYLYLRSRIKKSEVIEGEVKILVRVTENGVFWIFFIILNLAGIMISTASNVYFGGNPLSVGFSLVLGFVCAFGIYLIPLVFSLEARVGRIFIMHRL